MEILKFKLDNKENKKAHFELKNAVLLDLLWV